jgi:hypothetical protein
MKNREKKLLWQKKYYYKNRKKISLQRMEKYKKRKEEAARTFMEVRGWNI